MQEKEPRKRVSYDQEREYLERALDLYLESCYANAQRSRAEVNEFAAALGLSRQHLARRFLFLTGRTALERMREKQLERARRLLITTDLSIEQVGFVSAFGGAGTFARLFRDHFGMTAGSYRRAVRAELQRRVEETNCVDKK